MRYIFIFLLISVPLFAQTGIGTTTPHASAKLDVSASDKGFLPPRVTLTSASTASPITSPAEGLLVYNLGSVGLQAGYYYWNGAGWATIATASLSGDNVQSTSLVKLYQEAYSTASNKAPSSGGFIFTVPVSGRYEFNFNCTAWNANGSKVLLTFNIRQGTSVLGTDYHESTSSNVWAEYEGRVEVNLSAGVTYNAQVVTTTGNRDTRDWDKIVYKLVAGNLPINQHIASTNIQLNSNYLSNDGGNEGIRIDNSGNVGIGTATPAVALDVTGAVNANTLSLYNSTIGTPSLVLRNGDAAASYSDIAQIKMGWSGSAAGKSQYAHFLHTRHNSGTGGNAIDFYLSNGTADNTIATGSTKAMTIESPGNLTVAGKISHADPSGSVSVKASGWVNAGSFVSLDNINATIAASGNRGLCISTGSGSIITYMSGTYGITGGMGGGALNTTITFNTNLSTSIFGWHFGSVGDAATYHMNDTTNNKFYRITIMIGYGFNNNFITIERLL